MTELRMDNDLIRVVHEDLVLAAAVRVAGCDRWAIATRSGRQLVLDGQAAARAYLRRVR